MQKRKEKKRKLDSSFSCHCSSSNSSKVCQVGNNLFSTNQIIIIILLPCKRKVGKLSFYRL